MARPRLAGKRITLQVHSVRAAGDGDIEPIVHEHASPVHPAHEIHTTGDNCGQITIVQLSFADLYQMGPGAGGGHNARQPDIGVPAGGQAPVGDHADHRAQRLSPRRMTGGS